MGFICPDCGKDFGRNKEWFEDHCKAHQFDNNHSKIIVIQKEQNTANLKSIQNAIKSDKIRVWMNFDGGIVFENTKTKNQIIVNSYYTMQGEIAEA